MNTPTPPSSKEKLYAERDVIEQMQHYVNHVEAMTAEGLHSKSDIAAELAHRDIEIERLQAALFECFCAYGDGPVHAKRISDLIPDDPEKLARLASMQPSPEPCHDETIKSLCDRIENIFCIAIDTKFAAEDRVRKIQELSGGFMQIPPCSQCGQGHAEPEKNCPAPPPEAWRCFHCEEVFTDRAAALEHFGPHQGCDAGCTINIEEYRRMEECCRSHHADDTELHRALCAKDSEMHTAVRRAEEQGYARGLDAAKRYPETLGLTRADPTKHPEQVKP